MQAGVGAFLGAEVHCKQDREKAYQNGMHLKSYTIYTNCHPYISIFLSWTSIYLYISFMDIYQSEPFYSTLLVLLTSHCQH